MNYRGRCLKFFLLVFVFVLAGKNAFSLSEPKAGSAFYNISLTTAKQMASQEGKNIFVEFYANWCVPCKWMEETTFTDPAVQKVLKEDYIAVRVDIDDFDGFAVKEHYNINVLPTILILDEHGRSLERKEQSLTASMLMDILKTEPINYEAPVNTSPELERTSSGELPNRNSKNSNIITDQAAVKTTSYRVQVGVFTDYANTEKLVGDLRKMSDEPIVVLNDYLNNKTVFKILVGDFETREKADHYKNTLWQNYGIDGFVK